MSELRQRVELKKGRPRTRRSISSVKKSCDRLWSQIIRARGTCERCGARPEDGRGFHAHHVYGRSNHRLRFAIRNGVAFCAPCHRWAEEVALEFTDWFREYRPDDVEWLAAEHRKGLIKRNLADYLELEESLREILSRLPVEIA